MKLKWITLAVVAVTAVSCGKPKPREVTQLQVDGKTAEIKADQLARLRAQVEGLCELAEFFATQVRTQKDGGQAQAGEQGQVKLMKLESTEQDRDGAKTTTTSTASTVLGDGLGEALAAYGQIKGKPVDLQAVANLRAQLEAVRSGWSVATLYHSDTAPLDSLKSFGQYRYLLAKITPSRLECMRESVVRDQPRR